MYQALYRKWRPSVFEDVYGQGHITSILKSEVENGKISHAYLFCGPRGTGKTTCAKIIAKAANCENLQGGSPCCKCPSCLAIDNGTTTDVIEMDAASNNGVDDIRDIRDGVVYTPADLKYKVYIIDEVHMLSTQAFNALLKTLEEPPKHVIFILATTELHKIPATVLSRCQRFDFRRVTPTDLIERMKVVCAGEQIEAEEEALALIARLSQGAFRDALNMLEFCSSERKTITYKNASELLGASSAEMLYEFAKSIAQNNVANVLDLVNEVYLSSRDIAVFWRELISFLRDVLVCCVTRGEKTTGDVCTNAANLFAPSHLVKVIEEFTSAEADMTKNPSSAKLYSEIALIKATEVSVKTDTESLEKRISDLEQLVNKLQSGTIVVNPIPHDTKIDISTSVSTPKKENVREVINETKENISQISLETQPKVIRKWSDISRAVSNECPPIANFMFRSIGKIHPDGKVVIYFDSKFVADTFKGSSGSMEIFVKAYNRILGENLTLDKVFVDVIKKNEEIIRHPIDDLIEKLGKNEEN